jgi:uncharacterized RDD family membrane protein YckC
MKEGIKALILLAAVYVVTEIILLYFVVVDGNGDVVGAGTKTLLFLLFILLFSKRLAWAKWVLSVSLVLHGLLCIIAGFEGMVVVGIVGLYDIFFGIALHKLRALGEFRNGDSKNANISIAEVAAPIDRGYTYPTLATRYKALFIDAMLLLFVLIVIMLAVDGSSMRTPIMVSSAFVILLTYEPMLTTYSRTVGQRLMRIRVGRYADPTRKIGLVNAYIRWFAKGLLGWVSFVTIHFNQERRAIHDLASDSMVISEQ